MHTPTLHPHSHYHSYSYAHSYSRLHPHAFTYTRTHNHIHYHLHSHLIATAFSHMFRALTSALLTSPHSHSYHLHPHPFPCLFRSIITPFHALYNACDCPSSLRSPSSLTLACSHPYVRYHLYPGPHHCPRFVN